MAKELTSSEIEELASLIEWGGEFGVGSPGYVETPIHPKSEVVSSNNNLVHPFSDDGVDERCLEYWEKMEYRKRPRKFRNKIENNKIKTRIEILDL